MFGGIGVATILGDGRIHAAGSSGNCAIFQPPNNIRNDVKRFADEIYEDSTARAAISSRNASSNDEVAQRVSACRKRGCEEYEKGYESAQETEMKLAVKGMENELKVQKKCLEEMEKKAKLEVEAHKEEIKKIEERIEHKMKLQHEAHKVERKKMEEEMKLELKFLKAAFIKNQQS